MTNREKFKDELDAMLVTLMAVVNGKPVICDDASCRLIRRCWRRIVVVRGIVCILPDAMI